MTGYTVRAIAQTDVVRGVPRPDGVRMLAIGGPETFRLGAPDAAEGRER